MISQITPAGIESGQTREIDRGLGLPGAHEHAAFARAQRKRVTGPQEIGGFASGSSSFRIVAARSCAEIPVVVRPRASTDTVERGFEHCGVVAHHLRNLQFVEPRSEQRHADQAAGLFAHEVDRLGRDLLGRHHEVAFVFAVLVVEDDDHLAGADVVDCILDRIERRGALGRRRCQAGSTAVSRCSVRYDGSRRPERSSDTADSVIPALAASSAAERPAASIAALREAANWLIAPPG